MKHVVTHRSPSGELQLDELPSLEAALELVEHLRNGDAPEVRLLREVPVEVRTYYRVVVAEEPAAVALPDAMSAADPAAAAPIALDASAIPEPPPGAMPLLAPSVAAASESPAEVPGEAAGEPARRPSLFSRGG